MSDPAPRADRSRQAALDELVTVLAAPAVVLSDPDGQVRGHGAQGVYLGDVRLCCRLEITVDGSSPRPVAYRLAGPGRARFDAQTGGSGSLVRTRTVDGAALVEDIELVNPGSGPLEVRLAVCARSDLAAMYEVKNGGATAPVTPRVSPDAVAWSGPEGGCTLTVEPPADSFDVDGTDAVLTWQFRLDPGERGAVRLTVAGGEPPAGLAPFIRAPARPWSPPGDAATPALDALLRASLRDLDALLLADPLSPASTPDVFAAAGSPWYYTLFGRDSLWTARLLLPLDTSLAGGTLRALARRQGRRDDAGADEEPGKILHEVRAGGLRGGDLDLPPLYYGTVDATALWCCLLHDAWRAGLPDDEVAALLPNLEAALAQIERAARATGFLVYRGSTGGGLANQGWKDSLDGVRWADGTIAQRPVALCEAQGYAFAAACGGAALLEAFGRPGAAHWSGWAADLQARFRGAFWIDDADGRYPAIALDGHGRAVTGPASNMGHLLSTGLLSPAEADLVAARLTRPDLDCGVGLRTLSSAGGGFDPLSYHCGSIWPHDTAVTALGLAGTGHTDAARSLAAGIAAAATRFGDRLPELYGVLPDGTITPYPAACSPQTWAAAAGVVAVGLLSDWPLPAWSNPS